MKKSLIFAATRSAIGAADEAGTPDTRQGFQRGDGGPRDRPSSPGALARASHEIEHAPGHLRTSPSGLRGGKSGPEVDTPDTGV